MKAIFRKYKFSKYHKLICGTIFALLAFPFFIWGLSIIVMANGSYIDLVLPFLGVLLCLVLGLYFMFRKDKSPKVYKQVKNQN